MPPKKKNVPIIQRGVGNELRRAKESQSHYVRLANYELKEVPNEVFGLRDVASIDLSDNQLISIPERLFDLPNLRDVTLVGNPIETLPNVKCSTSNRKEIIIDLPTYLRCIDQADPMYVAVVIGRRAMQKDVTLFGKELKAGRCPRNLIVGEWSITIGDNHRKPTQALQSTLDLLPEMKSLEWLSIRGLKMGNVPEAIQLLPNLKNLNLDALALRDLPTWITELRLEHFSAVDNRISTLPDSLNNWKNLTSLELSWNPLKRFPKMVFDLSCLEELGARRCDLTEIPADLLRLEKLKLLHIDDNSIESPPAEVSKKGLDAIRDYWRQRAETGVDYLCEAKLIILGEAGAGKTSLARKIEDPNYKLVADQKSTEGIDVIRYQFPTAIRTFENGTERVLERTFQVNIWDFGGQEIYHATHQFFLTRRSVYVLVCDDRKEDTDFSYWLQVVQMLSDASPLLIVQNEKQDRTRDINLSSLRANFGNLRDAIPTNLDTNRGLNRVIQSIRNELERLPHIGVGLPRTWKRVREALEQDPRDYISLTEFLDICEKRGFTRHEDKLQLSEYLHDLGISLHFQDDPLLKNTVILKPSWGTDAVYRVLDDPEIIAARGQFTKKQLGRIWSETKYVGMQHELLRLMMKFQLCYELEASEAYIAPQLLSSEQPSYLWDQKRSLIVRYEYEFLPKGIITRFIVAMHRLIAGGRLVWKSGVVLERDGTRAEVIEEYSQRRIRVRMNGADPHGLFAIVDEQLERIHSSFGRLQYERYLPCPCVECAAKAEPYGFALDKLMRMAAKGQPIQCHVSGEMVGAARLVREILPGALRRREYNEDAAALPFPQIAMPTMPEVFVSYAWTSESDAIVDRVQEELQEHGIRLLRDREEVRYKDSIRDFMRRIGQGKAVVVVISEKYLKSENCMFEMLEIAKAQSLREKVFPIVLPDANIYKATGRAAYVGYWENEIRQLDQALKPVRADNLSNLHDDLDLYSEIRRLFDGIAHTLRDMNALTLDQHEHSGFEELIRRIRAQLSV